MNQNHDYQAETNSRMLQAGITRRDFLRLAGGTLGLTALACSGLSGGSTGEAEPPAIEMIETTYGGTNTVKGKILVAYASRAGSTAGVAEAVSRQLAEDGMAVDLRELKNVDNLDGYQAVVLGSAIQSGAWLPEAVAFVEKHRGRLNSLPLACFLVCMMATKQDEKSRGFVAGFLEPVRQMVRPIAEGRFTGALYPSRHSLMEGLGLRIFMLYLGLKAGDYRDWDTIRDWTAGIRPLLAA